MACRVLGAGKDGFTVQQRRLEKRRKRLVERALYRREEKVHRIFLDFRKSHLDNPNYFLHICLHACLCVSTGTRVPGRIRTEVREQLSGVGSLQLPCGVWERNSRACVQAPLPTGHLAGLTIIELCLNLKLKMTFFRKKKVRQLIRQSSYLARILYHFDVFRTKFIGVQLKKSLGNL